ncbi:MAG: hypothetical protein R6V53_03335 [Candidatus Woesearchaeota archaeon]
MNSKKGIGLSMQMIVGMIIMLVILAFSLYIMNDRFGLFDSSTSYECSEEQTSSDCSPGELLVPGKYTGTDEDKKGDIVKCCKAIG